MVARLCHRLVAVVPFVLVGCYDKPGSGDAGGTESSSGESASEESGSGPGTNSTTNGTTSTSTASSTATSTASTTDTTTDTTTTGPACVDRCAGCCMDGECMPGDADPACGAGGGACAACENHENCGAGACELDLDHQWTLSVVSAELLFAQDNGGPGSCGHSLTDAYVVVFLNTQMGQTTIIEENLMPVWDEEVLVDSASVYLDNVMMIQVWDDDGMGNCSPDDLIESCAHQVDQADLESGGFVIDFCGNGVADFTFSLAP